MLGLATIAIVTTTTAVKNRVLCSSGRFQRWFQHSSIVCYHIYSPSSWFNFCTIKVMVEADTISIIKAQSQSTALGNKQALISLFGKKKLAFLRNGLQSLGYTIVSIGGTTSALENAGVSISKVE